MASSGKKGKKPKGKTIALTDFLADGASPGTVQTVVRSRAWADEVENDDDIYDMGGRNKQPVILPTAPRATREPNVDDENIPRNPPFNAYISNLQYDVDEEEITEFFADMTIVNVRLPRDDRGSGRLKGFGYVEFESRESLIAALSMGDTTIKGRRMRIEVASSSDGGNNDRRRGGSDRGYDNRDSGGPDRTQGDWRSGPREEPASGDRPGGFGRDNVDGARDRGSFTRDNMDGPKDRGSFTRDNMDGPKDRGSFTRDNMDGPKDRGSFTRDNMDGPKDRGSFTRDNMDGPKDRGTFTRDNMDGPRDRGSFTRDNMDGPRDRGTFTRDNMDGPKDRGSFTRDNMDGPRDRGSFTRDNMDGPRDRGSFTRDNMEQRSFTRDGMDGPREGGFNGRRDGYESRGSNRPGNRDDAGSGFRGGYGDGYQERERYGGGGWGGDRDRGERDFGPRRSYNKDERDLPEADKLVEPKTRPKLNLAQRSVPETTDAVAEPAPAQAAIFGGARPVDTAAREREIEERLAKQRDQTNRIESDKGDRQEKVEKEKGEEQPAVRKVELAQPPAENAWQRRAAQQAAEGVTIHPHPINNGQEPSRPPRETEQPRRNRQYDNMERGGLRGGRGSSRGAPSAGSAVRGGKREPRKDSDEPPRMPKLREQAAPNFIVTNKYGLLPSEEEANE